MNDMTKVIIAKSDQLGADDLIGGPRTIQITGVQIKPGTEQPVSISFVGDENKPYKPSKGMCRILVALWGPDANAYAGRSLTLYREPGVKWGGMEVGGIRISHASHLDTAHTIALTQTKGVKKLHTVRPLVMDKPASDKAADGVRDLVERIRAAKDVDALKALTAADAVVKQRAWLLEKRPELAQDVDAAVQKALASFDNATTAEQDPETYKVLGADKKTVVEIGVGSDGTPPEDQWLTFLKRVLGEIGSVGDLRGWAEADAENRAAMKQRHPDVAAEGERAAEARYQELLKQEERGRAQEFLKQGDKTQAKEPAR